MINQIINRISKIRFGWYPNIVSFLLLTSITFSILSSFDCQFIQVNIGFEPEIETPNLILPTSSDIIRVGLWSFEVYNSGLCVDYSDVGKLGNDILVNERLYENPYSNWLLNGDVGWTVSRVSVIIGGVFGLIALVSMWLLNFNVIRLSTWSKELLLHSTCAALVFECFKLGMFFNIIPCNGEIWPGERALENGKMENGFHRAQSCSIDRGGYASILSFICYLISMILIVGFLALPKKKRCRTDVTNMRSDNHSETKSTFSRIFAQTMYSNSRSSNSRSHLSSRSGYGSKSGSGSKGTSSNSSGDFFAHRKARFETIKEVGQEESSTTGETSSEPTHLDFASASSDDRRRLETTSSGYSHCESRKTPNQNGDTRRTARCGDEDVEIGLRGNNRQEFRRTSNQNSSREWASNAREESMPISKKSDHIEITRIPNENSEGKKNKSATNDLSRVTELGLNIPRKLESSKIQNTPVYSTHQSRPCAA